MGEIIVGQKPFVKMVNIKKRFGEVVALDGVSIDIYHGEVLGLLGENGAGKTTLMNILFGLYRADEGEIYIDGRRAYIRSPRDSIKHGIFMVHQHFKLINNFTVLENIIVGTQYLPESIKPAKLDDARKKIRDLMDKFKLYVNLDAKIRDLPVGVRQRVEILKALYRGAKLLILDEPTTNLTPQEVDNLLKSLREMVQAGLSIVFITHKIREVLEVADRITVLRLGKVIGTLDISDADEIKLVRMMVGERISVENSILFKGLEGINLAKPGDRELLKLENVYVVDDKGVELLKKINLVVHDYEILGVAGVAGNGQRELVETIIGVRKPIKGRIYINDIDVTHLDTSNIYDLNIAYIPEDRLNDGILPTLTVAENIVLGSHKKFLKKRILIDYFKVREVSRNAIKNFEIKTPSELGIAGRLSGGNIQKLMIARAFLTEPKVLVAHNITRGLDVATTEYVLRRIIELKNKGSAILYVSEDLDELLLISDRIAVMYKGEIVGLLERQEFDKYVIGELMAGIRKRSS